MNHHFATSKPSTTRPLLHRFCRKQDGTVTLFGVIMFILMVGIGGIAIDVMRFETQRVQLQNTLDRAVLAAAALNQTLTPEDVVRDYFAHSGLENYRLRVDADEGLGFRTVSVAAEMEVDTTFLDLFGVRTLTTPAVGQAEESVQNIEIVLALDISNSMDHLDATGTRKIESLQSAATRFVDRVLASNDTVNDEMFVSVSLVPYSALVNVGQPLSVAFNADLQHTYSYCTYFAPEQFQRTSFGGSDQLLHMGNFDLQNWYNFGGHQQPWCDPATHAQITPWATDSAALQAEINSYVPYGNTAIDQGIRWAVALLDPSARTILTDLQSSGATDIPIHGDLVGRPFDYNSEGTMKVIILMTDGTNSGQYDLIEPFHSGGPSTVLYHAEDDRYSMYLEDTDEYWVPFPASNDSTTWNNRYGYFSEDPYKGAESYPLTWDYLFDTYTAREIAFHFFWAARRSRDWDYYNLLRYDSLEDLSGRTNSNSVATLANARTTQMCDLANASGVVIFTVAFEAPTDGQNLMRICATSDSHYYTAEGLEVDDAFASIANTINQLRLIR